MIIHSWRLLELRRSHLNMGKFGTKMPNFCLNRIRPSVRIRSPPVQSRNQDASTATSNDQDRRKVSAGIVEIDDDSASCCAVGRSVRRIMIVVDSSVEAKQAVQWALSHTVQNHDSVILLHVTKHPDQGPRMPEFLTSMKSMCQAKRPEVHVDVAMVGGKEKGETIVEEAKRREVALMVLGQKKRSVTWRLMAMWAGKRVNSGVRVAEYCVQNAGCMAIAVRRKSKKLGGYVITTKRQKDFWLLA